MNKTIVSIVVPVYNVENYLKKCVDSLRKQTYTNLEIILVNDGSPDNSPAMCDAYSKEDPRIRVIHKENGGLSDARNVGIEASTGDYLMFLDSDDYVEKNLVEKALETIMDNNTDLVIWGYYADYLNEEQALIKSIKFEGVNGTYTSEDFNEIEASNELIGLLGYAWNKLYKTELIKKNNTKFPKNISLVEDIIFNSKVLVNAKSINFIGDCLVHYMQRPMLTLGNMFYENYFDLRLMAMSSVEDILLSWELDPLEIKQITNLMGFNALKLTVKELNEFNDYNRNEKIAYLEKLFIDKEVSKVLRNVKVASIKDKLIRQLMIHKQSILLLNLYDL